MDSDPPPLLSSCMALGLLVFLSLVCHLKRWKNNDMYFEGGCDISMSWLMLGARLTANVQYKVTNVISLCGTFDPLVELDSVEIL